MTLRAVLSSILVGLIIATIVCGIISFRSKKEYGKQVGFFLLTLVPPVFGNLLIIQSRFYIPALVGHYLYYIGIILAADALLSYVFAYCKVTWQKPWQKYFLKTLIGLDIAQFLVNIFTHHAFGIEKIELYGGPYYRMIPHLSQNLHRGLIYLILVIIVAILIKKMTHSSRIHARRYAVIFLSLLLLIIWGTYYVISRTPMDSSMIGYAVFGLLIFYFSLYYKPLRLIDRILINISAELPGALFFFDDAEACIWMNKEGREFVGIDEDPRKNAGKVREVLEPFFKAGNSFRDDWANKLTLGDGAERRYYALKRHLIRDKKGYIDGSFLSIQDETGEQASLQKEYYHTRHDELTDLYTKTYLYKRISEALTYSDWETSYSIAFINVRNFKLINDVFGNAFGDEVIKNIADLIRKYAPIGSIYGRLEGDTFGALVERNEVDLDAIEKLLTGFTVDNGEMRYHVMIRIGIYRVKDTARSVPIMFERARMALANNANNYNAYIAVYNDETRENMMWEQIITSELRDAIHSRQIQPYLQPLVDTSGNVVGAEALARWIHPKWGFLSPDSFIPFLEKNGLITEVDRYMWRCACELLCQWDNELFISINISPKDFYYIDVAKELKSLVQEFRIDPSRLRVEITESVMISDTQNIISILKDLQDCGFVIELDDFGSGYSSLNVLKDMPIDVLKIDMAFLRNAEHDVKSEKILLNIIRMSRDLNLVSLTEGVETDYQFNYLSEIGCQLFQGYYFAKPMSVDQFTEAYVKTA